MKLGRHRSPISWVAIDLQQWRWVTIDLQQWSSVAIDLQQSVSPWLHTLTCCCLSIFCDDSPTCNLTSCLSSSDISLQYSFYKSVISFSVVQTERIHFGILIVTSFNRFQTLLIYLRYYKLRSQYLPCRPSSTAWPECSVCLTNTTHFHNYSLQSYAWK